LFHRGFTIFNNIAWLLRAIICPQTKDQAANCPFSLQFLAMFLRGLRAGADDAPVFFSRSRDLSVHLSFFGCSDIHMGNG
jgi:hypothetical protein